VSKLVVLGSTPTTPPIGLGAIDKATVDIVTAFFVQGQRR
jgi:hypothetical protein